MTGDGSRRCPRCGRGELIDIAFDEGTSSEVRGVGEGPEDAPAQLAGTRQIETYSCGHEVVGPRLSAADETTLDVERRASEETTEPTPATGRRVRPVPESPRPRRGAPPTAGS